MNGASNMNNDELDTIFSVLENPIRRKILSKLAKEQHYPLQLSKELNISQQAIMKHLKVLEDNNLVISFEEKSTLGGPPRKCYVSNKHITLRIDVGPNTFNTEVYDYKEMEKNNLEGKEIKEEIGKYEDFINDYKKSKEIKDPSKKLNEFSKIIQNVDKELHELKMKGAKLLSIRENIIHESNNLIAELCREYDERKILYYLISHEDRNISSIADALELREKVILEIFRHLMNQRLFFKMDDDIIRLL